jgi:hypothetical protein
MAALFAYIRKTGSDNNGGSSNGTSPDRTGTDGVTNGTTTFVAASGSFTSGDVDKIINIVTKGRYRITGFTNSTTVTLSGSPSSGSGLTWNLGGAVATIGAILANANAAVTNGDTVYIGAGVYREVVTMGLSPTAEVVVAGDVDGSKTGDAGEIQWTAYLTSDTAIPSSTAVLITNQKDFFTFRFITFIGGNAATISSSNASSTDWKIEDCTFITGFHGNQNINHIFCTGGFGVALNWTVDRCRFLSGGRTSINITLTTGSGADYDANFLIRDCICISGAGSFVSVTTSGTSTEEGGGVDVVNCTYFGQGAILATVSVRVSLSVPCTINNSVSYGGGISINSAESGAMVEDYNLLYGGTAPRALTATGTHSVSSGYYAPLFFVGQELQYGANLRPFGMPAGAASPLLGFGNDGNAPSVDILNRIRPAGGASTGTAVGAYEYHDSAVRETSTVRTGSSAIKFSGPGDHEFVVPVNNALTTIKIYTQFDGSYAGTKPQMQIINGTEIGVADATATAVGSSGSWEELSLTFTPTAKGIITVRLISNSTAASGNAYFDDFSIS